MNKTYSFIILTVIGGFILSICQLYEVWNKYYLFLTDYHRQLWENHITDSAFFISYLFTSGLLVVGYKILTSKRIHSPAINWPVRTILVISIVISLTASTGLFIMHRKHMLVGYHEWIMHYKQTGEQSL